MLGVAKIKQRFPKTVYWDPAVSAGSSLGGAGTWNLTTQNWWDGASGSDQLWVQSPDKAVFWGASAGTVTVSVPVTCGGMIFKTNNYQISNSANTISFIGETEITLEVAAARINGTSVAGNGNVTLTGLGSFASIIRFTSNTNTGWSGISTLIDITLQFENQNKVLANTSAIALYNGRLYIVSGSGTQAGNNRINDSAPWTVNGGAFWYQTMKDTDNWRETIGVVTTVSGQFDVYEPFDKDPFALTQNVYITGLVHMDGSAVTFSAAGAGLQITYNRIQVVGETPTSAGQVIGAWATAGTSPDLQTDYAIYDASAWVIPAAIAASAESTWTTAANAYTFDSAPTLSATRTITALRNSGGALTLALGNYYLETYGLLNGGTGLLTVSTAGTGALRTPTGGGYLYITTGNAAITISAPITDNGGAVSLVKSGTGGILTLSGTNTYTGSTIINAGTLSISSSSSLPGTAVSLQSTAVLNLNFVGTKTVASFSVDSVDQGTGTFGAIGSGADHETALISGTGLLSVS